MASNGVHVLTPRTLKYVTWRGVIMAVDGIKLIESAVLGISRLSWIV